MVPELRHHPTAVARDPALPSVTTHQQPQQVLRREAESGSEPEHTWYRGLSAFAEPFAGSVVYAAQRFGPLPLGTPHAPVDATPRGRWDDGCRAHLSLRHLNAGAGVQRGRHAPTSSALSPPLCSPAAVSTKRPETTTTHQPPSRLAVVGRGWEGRVASCHIIPSSLGRVAYFPDGDGNP